MNVNKARKTAVITMDVESPERFSESNLKLFLNILGEYDLRATFFVTFTVVEQFPQIIPLLLKDGHEIASHGYTHPISLEEIRRVFKRTEKDIIIEIEKSREFLGKFGVVPSGIRLPAFYWNMKTLEIISRFFKYDSSLTCKHVKKKMIYRNNRIKLVSGKELFEIPVSSLNYIGIRLGTPLFFKFGAHAMALLVKRLGVPMPLVFYSHSFDLTRLDIQSLPVKSWKKKYYYQHCGPGKIEFFRIFFDFLKRENFKFLRCVDYLNWKIKGELL